MSRWSKALSILLVLAACATPAGDATTEAPGDGTETTATPSGATGGTVRIGQGGSAADLNPGMGLLVEDGNLYNLAYDFLIGIDFEGNFVPSVATDWSVSDDGLTWTMNLRPDVTFHDGSPLTADDVAFSFNLYKDTADYPYMPTYAGVFSTIEATGPSTVVLTTADPIANFEANVAAMYLLPKAIWEGQDPVAFANDEMIGSGPFMLAEHKPGEFSRLTANPDYWKGAPNVAEVIFQTIGNSDARVQALINGEVDMITEFPATAIAALRGAANVTVADGSYYGGRLADMFFNLIDPANCPTAEGGLCTGHPALRDVTVRRALAHGINKQELVDVALLGLGDTGLGLVPRAIPQYFADELVGEDYEFDLVLAASVLEEAGYVDGDGDGIRECPTDDCGPTGDLTFRLNFPTDIDEYPRVAEIISGWWSQIGVAVQIQGLDPDTLVSVCCPTFDYDVMMWSWNSGIDPDLLDVLNCDSIPSGYSETGFCDPSYDEVQIAQLTETDPAARRELIVELQRRMLEEVPYIIPWYFPKIEAYRTDRFTGWPDQFPILSLEDPASLRVIQPVG
ncbi:MAG: ABC transporter substrate-binding protein [Actinomycetota bacterium]